MTITAPTQAKVPLNIRKKAAADRSAIYDSIRERLRDGTFAEGDKLPTERELAENFGAARNSVRQALDRLVNEGFVTRQVGRGTFAASRQDGGPGMVDSHATLQKILEVRLMVEPQMIPLVVERAGAEDFEAMARCLDGIRHAQTWAEYKEWKYELHYAIVRATGNDLLIGIFEAIIRARRADHWGKADGTQQISDEVRDRTLEANVAIVDALREGRKEDAADAVRRYLTDTVASLHGV